MATARLRQHMECHSILLLIAKFWVRRFFLLILPLGRLACSAPDDLDRGTEFDSQEQALVLALAVLGEDAEGKVKTLPARVVILQPDGDGWGTSFLEDSSSTAFHKVMPYQPPQGPGGLLTPEGRAVSADDPGPAAGKRVKCPG